MFRPQNRPDARACLKAVDDVEAWDDQQPATTAFVEGEPFAPEAELMEKARAAVTRGGDVVTLLPEASRQYYRFAAVVAREVKNRMGCPKRTAANWLVAQDLVQKVLAEKHVRKVDRCKFAPVATQMVFIPTRYDVMGRKLAESFEVATREADFAGVGIPWWRKVFGIYTTWKPPNIERG